MLAALLAPLSGEFAGGTRILGTDGREVAAAPAGEVVIVHRVEQDRIAAEVDYLRRLRDIDVVDRR